MNHELFKILMCRTSEFNISLLFLERMDILENGILADF
jgi:hypothetical protein